jgi:fatty acid synthase subunit alpha, fungi type
MSAKRGELLAYQFASPVKWIQIQDIFFNQHSFERFVEIRPGPTLTGMATRAKYEAADDSVSCTRAIYCHAKNPKEIYYQFKDEPEALVTENSPAPVAAAPIAVPVAASSGSGPAALILDEPHHALDTPISPVMGLHLDDHPFRYEVWTLYDTRLL